MLKSQAILDLVTMLSGVTSTDRAWSAVHGALTTTGLAQAQSLDQADIQRLLLAIAAQGGPIEQVVRQIAVQGLDDTAGLGIITAIDDPTDRSAA